MGRKTNPILEEISNKTGIEYSIVIRDYIAGFIQVVDGKIDAREAHNYRQWRAIISENVGVIAIHDKDMYISLERLIEIVGSSRTQVSYILHKYYVGRVAMLGVNAYYEIEAMHEMLERVIRGGIGSVGNVMDFDNSKILFKYDIDKRRRFNVDHDYFVRRANIFYYNKGRKDFVPKKVNGIKKED